MNETDRWTPSTGSPEGLTEELEHLNDKLDRLMTAVALIDRRRDDLEEMLADLLPAANGAVRVATNQLWALERKGTLNLARETFGAFETASRRIDPDDLRALGDNAGEAVRTLSALTGPEVASASQRTVRALQKARTGKPPGFFSLLRRLGQPHVRRGLAAVLDILDGLGEGAHPAPTGPAPAPSVNARPRAPRPTASLQGPSSAAPVPPSGRPSPAPSALAVEGRSVPLDPDGFLADPEDWTPDVAETLAAESGIGPLTDEHWNVLEFCRRDAQQRGGAPGLRRITKELQIPPKDMYRLFPKGPGTLAARLAGLEKPKSCV